jgi:hypothetical protein
MLVLYCQQGGQTSSQLFLATFPNNFNCQVTNNSIQYRMTNNSYFQANSAKVNFTNNTWYHAAITFDQNGNNVSYINGQQLNGVSFNFPVNYLTYTLNYIGNNQQNTSNYTGLIDEYRMFNRVLTPSEINALYNYSGITYLSNNNNNNYTIIQNIYGTIYPKLLSIYGYKVYDSTTNAYLTLSGIVNNDNVTISNYIANYLDSNVGLYKFISASGILIGNSANNYTIPLTGIGYILPALIYPNFNINSKIYDKTLNGTINGYTLYGIYSSDVGYVDICNNYTITYRN